MLPFVGEFLRKLSVVVPFTKDDPLWKDLLRDLIPLPQNAEVLLVGPDEPEISTLRQAKDRLICPVKYIRSAKGRARQMNTGARAAKGVYFWFLHADTKVPRLALYKMTEGVQNQPEALHYFDLQFLNDGPSLVGLNSIVANWRAQYLGMPFGDQGFVLSRRSFFQIGGFSERVGYGEDHSFVWEARRKRIPVYRIPTPLFTSARKYQTEGWGRVTAKRFLLTYKQAFFEFMKLAKQRAIE